MRNPKIEMKRALVCSEMLKFASEVLEEHTLKKVPEIKIGNFFAKKKKHARLTKCVWTLTLS